MPIQTEGAQHPGKVSKCHLSVIWLSQMEGWAQEELLGSGWEG